MTEIKDSSPYLKFLTLKTRIIFYSSFHKIHDVYGYQDEEICDLSRFDQRILYNQKQNSICYYRRSRSFTDIWEFKDCLTEEDIKFLKEHVYWFPELFKGL